MIISSFNIQNNINSYNKSKTEEIIKYLVSNNIDVLGLQELFKTCNKDLKSNLSNTYRMVGRYRYFNIFLKKNEKNPIISKYKIIKYKTYHLPSYPSKYKRIITNALIEYNGKYISIYNTHLEILNNEVKEKQFNRILDILMEDSYPKIIMGDFNAKLGNPLFDEFISKLEKIGIKRIEFEGNTFKFSKDLGAIDHMFMSSDFKVLRKEVIKTLDISDHYPIMVEIDV